MGASEDDRRIEGWLYRIRSNRLGMQHYKRRYCVLEENSLKCYRSAPASKTEGPRRSVIIDPSMRVADNGQVHIHSNEFYVFTLYDAANQTHQLKFGARNSEEAARWTQFLTQAAQKEWPNRIENSAACHKRRWQSLRLLSIKERNQGRKYSIGRAYSLGWTVFPSMHSLPVTSDVVAPSSWTIFGCKNGLRFFKEARDGDLQGKCWYDHPAVMAVGVVDATSDAIFQIVMSLGPSRSEWDFCFSHGRVIEQLDDHTDVIHKKLSGDWMSWGMKSRDLLLQRYWRREDDGTYMILYHSVFHPKCCPMRGCIRAFIKSGGYIITPVNQGKQSVVKHMLAVDWKIWKTYLFPSGGRHITMQMLGRVAALRELFRAKLGNNTLSDFSLDDRTKEIGPPQCETEDIKREVQLSDDYSKSVDSAVELQTCPSKHANRGTLIHQQSDVADEFFDVLDEPEYDSKVIWPSDAENDSQPLMQNQHHYGLTTAAVLVRRNYDLAVPRKGCNDVQEAKAESAVKCKYGATLPKDSSCNSACTWAAADPSAFLIRGETYLQDQQKVKATKTLMQLVAADWIKSDKREDDLGGRSGGIVQKYAAQGGQEFFFIVNIQVPGMTTYNLAFYFMMDTPVADIPLLKSFVEGDDAYRNSRFKLIPYISKGSWIVKQSVGKKACIVGQGLQLNYFQGKNYLEVGVDVGSSAVARGVVSLVLSYLNNLVIELAFLIQGNTEEELPECLLGTCRVNHLGVDKAVPVDLW